MNKLFKRVAAAVVGMAMAIGVGIAVGKGESHEVRADTNYVKVAYYNFNDGTAASNTKYAAEGLLERFAGSADKTTSGLSDIVSNVTAATNVYPGTSSYETFGIKFGTSSANGSFTLATSKAVAKAVVVAAGWATSDKLSVGDSAEQTPGVAYNSTSADPLKTLSFTFTETSAPVFLFAKRGFIQSIEFYAVDNSGGGTQTTTLSEITGIDGTLTANAGASAWDLSGLTPKGRTSDMGATDTPVSIASYVTLSTEDVPGTTIGAKTVSVKVTPKDTALSALEKSFNVDAEVTAAPKGSEQNPYTVAEARAAIDAGSGTSNVYVRGIITEIITTDENITKFKNCDYWISDDGITSGQLEVYRGKGLNGADVTVGYFVVGDTVLVKGNLTKYNSTYEFAQGSTLLELVHDTNPGVTLDHNEAFLCADLEVDYFEITATAKNIANPTYSWTTTDTTLIELEDEDQATVTIWLLADAPATASVKLTVDDATTPLANPVVRTIPVHIKEYMFVSDAIEALADPTTVLENEYVAGVVVSVESINDSYGSLTYFISDDGTATNQLKVYGGLGVDGAKFSATTDLEVGKFVLIFGSLKTYENEKEIDKNNYQLLCIDVTLIGITATYTGNVYTSRGLKLSNLIVTGTDFLGRQDTVPTSEIKLYEDGVFDAQHLINVSTYVIPENKAGVEMTFGVEYGDGQEVLQTTFKVTPIALVATDLEVTYSGASTITIGSGIDFDSVEAEVTYNDGSKETADDTDLLVYLDQIDEQHLVADPKTLTFDAAGEHDIYIVLKGTELNDHFHVEVSNNEIKATSFTLSATELNLVLGGQPSSGTITATLDPANSTDVVSWNVSQTSEVIETVKSAKSITVTAKAVGTATITATVGQLTAQTVSVTVALQQWTLTLDPGEATGTAQEIKVDDGATYTLPAQCPFTYEGHEFTGWLVQGSDPAVILQGGTTTPEFGGNVTLVAQWKVTQQQGNDGSQAHPYTVAEALAVCQALNDGATTENEVYVKGYVVGSVSEGTKTAGTYKFDIADTADGTDKLTIYYAAGDAKPNAGDQVQVIGKLMNYVAKNGTHTYEITDTGSSFTILNSQGGGEGGEGGQGGGGEGGGDTPTPTPSTKTLQSIEVVAPTKTNYFVGDSLDLTGFKVILHYTDGSQQELSDLSKLGAITVDTKRPGEKVVTITYEGQTATFKINVSRNPEVHDGCHCSIIAGSALLSIATLLGAGLLILRKRKEK